MTEQTTLYNVENGIATITLNRPDKLNAFNEDVIAELRERFETARDDKDVRIVVLRGNGKSFCAGGDMDWMRRTAHLSRQENIDDAMQLGHLLELIYTLPKVTIALVHGHVFGGGVGLTACCDIALAEEGTKFCLSEVRIGLIPSIIAPYVIAAMGQRQSRRYFMTAERFDAAKAAAMGLVHEEVPKCVLDKALEDMLGVLKGGAPGAQSRGKNLLLEIAGKSIDSDIIYRTVEEIADARASDEGREGVAAFLNKEEPSWRKG